MRRLLAIFAGALILVFLLGFGAKEPVSRAGQSVAGSPTLAVDRSFGRMPLYFIRNEGQVDSRVGYYIQGKDKTIYFTSEGLTYVLSEKTAGERKHAAAMEGRGASRPKGLGGEAHRSGVSSIGNERIPEATFGQERGSSDSSVQPWVVKLDFVGANREVRPLGEEETEAVISYFRGSPEEWKTGISTYSRIVYRELWPGIDLVYYGTADRLKYDFLVHPGADPSRIRLSYRGAKAAEVNEEGRLEVMTPVGSFEDDVPVAWQEVDGKRADVAISYELKVDRAQVPSEARNSAASTGGTVDKETDPAVRVYGFRVGDYDGTQTLVLDPAVLVYCGYVGGSGDDMGMGIAVDSAGNAYITGDTISIADTFPVKVGPGLTYQGNQDAFVAKVNSTGTALVYCGYIGGSDEDHGAEIAADSVGNAYVTGYTKSLPDSFPVIAGPDITFNGAYDAFVAQVDPAGTSLVYCGYIGGVGDDIGCGIAVRSGRAYITGITYSTESSFPVSWGPDTTFNGGSYDAFVARVDRYGSALQYCGYIGGSGGEQGRAIAVDSVGSAYVTGWTTSSADFPVWWGPDITFNGGQIDAFVAKVDNSGAALSYCGYIGGSVYEEGEAIAVDSTGNAYIAGVTSSTETSFPVKLGPDLTQNGSIDAFVAKVDSSGGELCYCGYIGGSGQDIILGIAVDSAGNAYVSGVTTSTEATFPVSVGPDLTYNGGANDAFTAKVDAYGAWNSYCGYIGGSGNDYSEGIAVDGAGNAYIIGYTTSAEDSFPVKTGPDLTLNSSVHDAFVAKVNSAFLFKNDFNSDGHEDILWRYYGSGGNNVVWYMGDSGGGLARLEGSIMNRPTGEFRNINMLLGTPSKIFVDPREPGMMLDERTPQWVFRDAREAGVLAERKGQEAQRTSRSREIPVMRGTDGVGAQGFPRAGVTGLAWLGMDFLPGVDDPSWTIVGTGDFNRDGNVDILWRYAGSGGYNLVWCMSGVTLLEAHFLPSVTDLLWKIAGTGDFNGDGKVDILWRYAGSGGYDVVWYMDGMALLGVDFLPGVDDPSWTIVGTGDFNGDEKVDILWRYYGPGGYNLVWYMNGVAWLGMDFLPSVTDPLWKIAGVGDFSGDTKTDILWRYYGAAGTNVVWLMDGVAWKATEFLPPVSNPHWRIENH